MLFLTQASSAELPRRVLGIYDSLVDLGSLGFADYTKQPYQVNESGVSNLTQQALAIVLNHYGYLVESLDVRNHPLPEVSEMDQYALVVVWFLRGTRVKDPEAFVNWVEQYRAAGGKVLLMEDHGVAAQPGVNSVKSTLWAQRIYRALGIQFFNEFRDPAKVHIISKDASMLDFERKVDLPLNYYNKFRALDPKLKSYLSVHVPEVPDSQSDLVLLGPNGGMVAPGFAIYEESRERFRRQWKINPFKLVQTVLPERFPVPDVTTLNGKRLFYTHIDGDGFANVSTVDYGKWAVEVILEKVVKHYPQMPIGISLVVGDIHPEWHGSEKAIRIARELLAQPNVEAASHGFTHPFTWKGWNRTSAYQPKGEFRYEREIDDSVHWIEENILPPGKKVKMYYWTGDTAPPEEAIKRVERLGIGQINGGDSRIDRLYPSYTSVAPILRQVGDSWQMFSSASNENLYTRLWSTRFFGYRNVLETFKNTDSPRRLAAIDVYYHFYSGDKMPSHLSLKQVYDWVLDQDVSMVYPSEYYQIVQGFINVRLVETSPNVYEVRDRGQLNTLRLDHHRVDLKASKGIKAVHQINTSQYLSLDETVSVPLIHFKP